MAGYDLGKLFAGSRGTLGLITEATFRLHPLPVATGYVTIDCQSPGDVERLLAIGLRAPIAPVAAELDWPTRNAPIQLSVALEGDQDGVAQRASALASQLADHARSQASIGDQAPAWWGAGAAAQRDGTVFQIAFWPGNLGTILAKIRAAEQGTGLDVAVGGSAAAGVLHASVYDHADPCAVAGFLTGLRTAVGHREISGNGEQPGRASVIVAHAPTRVREQVDLYGPVQSLGLMRAVKQRFDPDRRMSPGRFGGGL